MYKIIIVLFIKLYSDILFRILSNKLFLGIILKDPALWPIVFKENERNKYIMKDYSFFQNKDASFESSKREYTKQNRYFSSKYYW